MHNRQPANSSLNVASESNAPSFLMLMHDYVLHHEASRFTIDTDRENYVAHRSKLSLATNNALLQEIEEADSKKLTGLIQACTEANYNGKNAFHWLAEDIYSGTVNMLSLEQLITLTQPFVRLIEKTDANTLPLLIEACDKPVKTDYYQGTNTLYWLAEAIYYGAWNKRFLEQSITLTQPFVRLIEKADAYTLPLLIQACARSAERGDKRGTNALYWLAKTIYGFNRRELPPQGLANISKPLLLLLEKVTTLEQVKQITDAIQKAGAMRPVRDQLKIYLVQNREHEDVGAKLTRLESYLDPKKPFNSFLATNTSTIFVRAETDLIKEIRKEVEKLKRKAAQQHLPESTQSSRSFGLNFRFSADPAAGNTNFPDVGEYSVDPNADERKHGKGL